MTAPGYLRFFGDLYGLCLTTDDCHRHLCEVGLDPDNDMPIETFSRGMKQRLGIARCTINAPELLLLDEPTNGLDPGGRRDIHDLLLRLNREHSVTIIISTHILDDVDRLCNRIAILDCGKVRHEGALSDRPSTQRLRYSFRVGASQTIPCDLDVPGVALVKRKETHIVCDIEGLAPSTAIKSLIEAGVPILEAEQVTGTLEDTYFLHTTGGAP